MACLFSLLYNIPLQGATKSPLAGGGCYPHLLIVTQLLGFSFQAEAVTATPRSSIHLSGREPTERSRCTEAWGAWHGRFLFQSTFWRNRTDLKENSELSSKFFLLQPARCQSLFCLMLTTFVNCSEWYLLICREFSRLPLLMNQMVSSWQLTRKIVPFPCCRINQESFLLLCAADTFLHTLNYLPWTDCSEVSTLKPFDWSA